MHRTVLLIDASTERFERCRGALAQIHDVGYSVVHCNCGSDALGLIEIERPDCTLIDASLPGNGGAAILHRIGTRFPYMPIIMLAEGHAATPQLEEMQGTGECQVLRSAVTPAMLHGAIDSAVRDADARKTSARIAALSRTVLIIDDNPDDREFCARALRHADERYQLFEAEGGDEGLALIEDQRPDCVLLDYSLPGRTGLDVLRRIHLIDAFMPVIMMTGQGHEEIAVQAMKGGAQNYLVKSGLTSQLLHQAVISAVEHAELERQITEQREQIYEQKLALAETSRLTMAVLDSAPCMIVATDLSGKVLVFNKELERVLGYSAQEVVGQHTPLLWSPQSPILAKAEALRAGKQPPGPGREKTEAQEMTFVRKDGRQVPVSLWVRELRDCDGQVVGFLGLGEDITERKRQLEAIKNSEETFRSAMEHAPCGMALIAPDGSFLKVNGALSRMLGLEADELRGTTLRMLTQPQDRGIDSDLVKKLEAGEIPSFTVEKHLVDKVGRTVEAQIYTSLVRGGDGKPLYWVVQLQDIGERKDMERMKHHFISLLGGELQTPISSIRGALSLIAGGMLQERPDMAARLVKIAHDNCEHLVTLIRDILDIDGMAVGRMRFDIEAEPLSRLIAAAVEDAQIRLGAQGVRLAIQPPAEDILVLADAGHLRQVLVSLIAFAGRLAAPGNTLQIGASLRGTTARIAVTESGPGVAPAFHGRSPADELAQPVAPPSGAKDAELSLHVGKLLIEHMGGRMGVDPTPPGSTFWIELPAEIARPQPVRAAG
jgi:PAS domain S-box-containing protein